jgi:hypothetical protein
MHCENSASLFEVAVCEAFEPPAALDVGELELLVEEPPHAARATAAPTTTAAKAPVRLIHAARRASQPAKRFLILIIGCCLLEVREVRFERQVLGGQRSHRGH